MTRDDFRKLSQARLNDAKALFNAKRFDGAYYLAGYAVECALKACIAKGTGKYDFPNKDMAKKCYTHNLTALIGLAGLEQVIKQETASDKKFETNIGVAKDWSEQSRYN